MTEAINDTQQVESEPVPAESLESIKERAEALQSLVDEFNKDVVKSLNLHANASGVVFQTEKGYDDDEKRRALLDLTKALNSYGEHVSGVSSLFKHSNKVDLGNLGWQIHFLQERLAAAPDIRYSRQAQIEKFGGKENVPGEKILDTWEETKEAIVQLKYTVMGLDAALRFLGPPIEY